MEMKKAAEITRQLTKLVKAVGRVLQGILKTVVKAETISEAGKVNLYTTTCVTIVSVMGLVILLRTPNDTPLVGAVEYITTVMGVCFVICMVVTSR
jgi:hypothetical protein